MSFLCCWVRRIGAASRTIENRETKMTFCFNQKYFAGISFS